MIHLKICPVLIFACSALLGPHVLTAQTYIPIASNVAFVYEEPSFSSKKIDEVLITDTVEVLKHKLESRSPNMWILIKTGRYDRNTGQDIVGWILDYHLGHPRQFKRVTQISLSGFYSCAGDYCLEIDFASDGTYKYSYAPCFDGNCNFDTRGCHGSERYDSKRNICSGSGTIYKFRKLFRLESESSNEILFLFLIRPNELCSPMFIECNESE